MYTIARRVLPLSLWIGLISLFLLLPSDAENSAVETGNVRWRRDFENALKESGTSKTPVLVLFQEVPGCAGCQQFGKEVLTVPLLVEAIESEFIPVLIYNNRMGKDREILYTYKERALNYQVIRFFNSKGEDIIPRKDRVWTAGGVSLRMWSALEEAKRNVPLYLQALALEYDTANQGTAVFTTPCFWSGEVKLGSIPGVVATEAGWIEGREAVKVTYSSKLVSLKELALLGIQAVPGTVLYVPEQQLKSLKDIPVKELKGYSKASPSDQKRQIQNLELSRKVPGLLEIQKTKINALIRTSKSEALKWLSPRQKAALEEKTKK